MDTHLVSERFVVLFCVLFFASWNWGIAASKTIKGLMYGITLLCLVIHISIIGYQWKQFELWPTEVRHLSNHIPRGSLVHHATGHERKQTLKSLLENPMTNVPTRAMISLQGLSHIDALLTIERDVFGPYHFTHKSKHILTVTPEMQAIDYPQGFPLGINLFLEELKPNNHIFHHSVFNPFDFILISYAERITLENQRKLSKYAVYKGSNFWLLKNPNRPLR